VNGQHTLPIRQRQVTQRLNVLHSSIAHQEVNASPLLGTLGKGLIHLRLITDIHSDRHGRSACLADLSSCGLACIKMAVGNANPGAFARKGLGYAETQTLVSTGDQSHPLLQPHAFA
jgi:hypothetical protein